jgi:hypothetical protein
MLGDKTVVSMIAAGIGTVATRSLPASVKASPSEGSAITVRISNAGLPEFAAIGRKTTTAQASPNRDFADSSLFRSMQFDRSLTRI